ncbi:MAG: signal peptidase I [Thermomicrobiales bacterium]
MNALLNVLATLGTLFAAVAIIFFALGYSIILFSTESMAPTITSGALSIVKTIPAAEVQIGDVLTVDRDDKAPVTHRVIAVDSGSTTDERVVRMQGDGNDRPDLEMYVISEARIEVATFPGLATPFQFVFWNPIIASFLFLGIGALATWAFWPKTATPTPTGIEKAQPDVDTSLRMPQGEQPTGNPPATADGTSDSQADYPDPLEWLTQHAHDSSTDAVSMR